MMGSYYRLGIQGLNAQSESIGNEILTTFATPPCREVHEFNTTLCCKYNFITANLIDGKFSQKNNRN